MRRQDVALRLRMASIAAIVAMALASSAAANPSPADGLERPLPAPQALRRTDFSVIASANPRIPNDRLRAMLAEPSTWVDPDGRLFIVEPTAPESTEDPVLDNPYDLADTFLLESRPGSQRTIFLDFDGDTVTGTAWNQNYASGSSIVATAWDLDGNPTTFSDSELTAIQSTWMRVAEDFAPFGVNVTTKDPGAAAITRSSGTDQIYGSRVLITNGTNPVRTSCGCGGIAYVGVFDLTSSHAYYQPAWVFTSGAKAAAEAISHEVGHNLGLGHDGTSSVGYYTGHGSWAPIMGVGYYKPISQWSQGEYSGANNTQDDLAVMTSHGLPVIADDHGDDDGSATPVAGTSFEVDGLIASGSDVDVFSLTVSGGTIDLTVTPSPVSPNLDVELELRDGDGIVVSAADPGAATVNTDTASGLSASLSEAVAPGTYTVHVSGTGHASPLDTGYSSYGSVGRYRLSGTASVSGVAPQATATVSATTGRVPLVVAFSGGGSDADGAVAAYEWDFGDGTGSDEASPGHTYTRPGTFSAVLTVTDDDGLSASEALTITVRNPVDVRNTSITGSTSPRTMATAVVTIANHAGVAARNVEVTGRWTLTRAGKVTTLGTRTGVTGAAGKVTSTAPRFTGRAGDVVRFCVTRVDPAGASHYAPTTYQVPLCTTWRIPKVG